MSTNKRSGWHYLKHVAVPLGLSLDDFAATVKVCRCSSCGNYYCDPWISPELASSLFCAGAPDHIAGWANFEHWVSSSNPSAVQRRNRRLDALLETRLGPVASYAEFGCPFQGFLLEMKGAESSPRQRLDAFSQALHRAPDVRWSPLTRIYDYGAKWAARLAMGYLRLRAVKESLQQGSRSDASAAGTVLRPARRTLLIQDATTCWGINCVRYGASCRYFAHSVLGASVMPFDEAIRNEQPQFDLIGIFNILDHTRSPLDVIRRSLEMAKAVLVVTHGAASAGKQHLYAFADSFPSWLNTELKDTTVEDLAPYIDKAHRGDYSCFLLNRKLS